MSCEKDIHSALFLNERVRGDFLKEAQLFNQQLALLQLVLQLRGVLVLFGRLDLHRRDASFVSLQLSIALLELRLQFAAFLRVIRPFRLQLPCRLPKLCVDSLEFLST